MPELPEVETICRSLRCHVEGNIIRDVEVRLSRMVKCPSPEDFRAILVGRKIHSLERRAKYMLFHVTDGWVLVIHLRMTGRLCYVHQGSVRDAYTRIVFHLNNGDALTYADTRTLGTLYAIKSDEIWRISGLVNMGPEPLSASFTVAYLQDVLKSGRGKIKSFLLNQKYSGGLGNIYVDECLILSKIHPQRVANTLTTAEIETLYTAINQVIADGIDDGGTTFRDYRNGNGEKGSHQENLFAYGREGLPCKFCGCIIEKIEVGGRGTHFCPRCQK